MDDGVSLMDERERVGSFVRTTDLSRSFAGHAAVAGVSLDLRRGLVHALTGESGSGKSTLLRLIAGFEKPDTGNIVVGGRILANHEQRIMLPPEKRRVGMVFQENALFPHLTVAENIAYGVERRKRPERVRELLQLVHLTDYADRYPHQISGGQAQRVALARALAPEPDLLLMDEPFSSLDRRLKTHLLPEIKRTLQAIGITTIFVSHDRSEVFVLADNISIMREGHIVQSGAPAELYEKPLNCYVADFFGEANFLHDSSGTFMIRPEHIFIGTSPAEHIGSEARVLQSYYRGEYREYWVEADCSNCFNLDIQRPLLFQIRHYREEAQQIIPQVGDLLNINFHPKNLIRLER